MELESSKKLYAEKIHHVIDYISEHLSEEISLETLSNEACFSQFHFHRIFTAYTGETPRDYIERTRLEKAANNLFRAPCKQISDIAFECGYSSVSSFSRAFRKYYKIPPREFLRKHIEDYHSLNVPEKDRKPVCNPDIISYKGMENIRETHFVYYETLNGYFDGIPKSWNQLTRFAKAHDLINDNIICFGIPYDNPGITPREKCRYRACISTNEDFIRNKGLFLTSVMKYGTYATFRFKGTTRDISGAYAYIYGEWLPQSGYTPDNIPLIEIYSPDMFDCKETELLEYTIALPVVPIP